VTENTACFLPFSSVVFLYWKQLELHCNSS